MRVCMVVSNLLEFGGLEEFAKNLAVGVQRQGVEVSVLSTSWVSPDNQYLRGLRENQIPFVSLPKWLSLMMTDWATKEKILKILMLLCSPLVLLMGLGPVFFQGGGPSGLMAQRVTDGHPFLPFASKLGNDLCNSSC